MDDIKQRLDEIDREFQLGPGYYYKQAVKIAPLVFCATGLMTGIIIQNYMSFPVWFWSGIFVSSAITILVFTATKQQFTKTIPVFALICFICLGAVRLASFERAGPDDIRKSVGSEPTIATLRGVIVTKPYIDSNDWQFSKFMHTDRSSSFYFKVIEAESINGWVKMNGLVHVRVGEPIFDLKTGDYIEIFCRLSRFEGATNPGEFDIAKYMARRRVYISAAVESRDAITVLQANPAGGLSRLKTAIRKTAIEALLGGSYPKNDEDSLLLALVLGYRTQIDKNIIEAFRETGLLHFICLSGMNFGILIFLIWWLCKAAGLLNRGAAITCIITTILFLIVVPENPPAFRAAVMCFSFCGAFIFRRRSNPYNSLALAAILLLLIRPTGLFEADWQLSFASVSGILLFTKPIDSFLREKAADWLSYTNEAGMVSRFSIKTASVICLAFSVSLAAWLASAGILIYHFYTIYWLSSIWTVLMSPLIGAVSFLGYLKLLVAFFVPGLAHIMGIIITYLSSLLIWIVKFITDFNMSSITTGKVPWPAIILYYPLIVFIFLFPLRNAAIKKLICTIAAAAIITMLAFPRWQNAHGDNLVITVLDVGHGQSLLAKLPDSSCMLFDAGSLSRKDIGSRIIIPFLRYKGTTKLDSVILSHGDIDHINGLPEVLNTLPIKAIYANKTFFNDSRPTTKFLRDAISNITEANALSAQYDKSSITVLWPIAEIENIDSISDNDKSIVLLFKYAGRQILLCSDIEKFAQKEILRLSPDLKADAVIAPHHGSIKTLEQDFISRIDPKIVISSCTASAFEKGQVIKQDDNFKSYYTGRDGAVTIQVTKKGNLKINTFLKTKQPF